VADPITINVDEFLAHPPARVWAALTEPDLLARWDPVQIRTAGILGQGWRSHLFRRLSELLE
jgi:uncharacterized protein YndB with AHSA1/START domain